MKKVFSRLPKKLLVAVATVAAVAGVASATFAWGPERPTYTIENPAPHVTFNSITNNPNYGDERTFFDVKDAANTSQGGFVDKANVTDGQELLLRVYVHNNAKDSLNASGQGVAKNTQVRVHLPSATSHALRANAYISADNAQPKIVNDTVDFAGTNGANFALEYVPGSAVAYTNAVPKGMKLNDSIVTTGAKIGYTKADGVVPGCFKYTSIVTIKVKVKMPRYQIQKSVRFEGQTSNDWKESVNAKANDTVEWRIAFTNTGKTPLNQVKVVDQVPAGLTVVPGSVRLYNGNYPNGYAYPNTAIQANGRQVNVNIGNYNPGINAFVLFKTKVPAVSEKDCGTKKFPNIAYATPEGFGTVNDGAEVLVDTKKVCEEPEKPTYECKAVSVQKLGGRKVRVSVNAAVTGGAKIKDYTYDFGDGKPTLLTDKNVVEYTFEKDGNYNVRVKVNFTVNGQTKTDDSEVCAAPVKFETPETPENPEEPEEQVKGVKTLPSTGPAAVAGIFAATSAAGAVAHSVINKRRN